MQHEREQFLQLGSHEVILKPFRADAVFECLKNLLHIDYIFLESPQKEMYSRTSHDMDYSNIHIPRKIHQTLKEAAQLHYVTRLRQSLPELVAIGEDGKKLADNLNLHLRNYDMQKIISILEQVNPDG